MLPSHPEKTSSYGELDVFSAKLLGCFKMKLNKTAGKIFSQRFYYVYSAAKQLRLVICQSESAKLPAFIRREEVPVGFPDMAHRSGARASP